MWVILRQGDDDPKSALRLAQGGRETMALFGGPFEPTLRKDVDLLAFQPRFMEVHRVFLDSLFQITSLFFPLWLDVGRLRVCILRSCLEIIHDLIIQSLAKPTAPESLSEGNGEQISGGCAINLAENVGRKRLNLSPEMGILGHLCA